MPPRTVINRRPCMVEVSAHASLSERKVAPRSEILSSRFNRSRVERASRSSRQTITVSPSSSLRISLPSSGRSVLAPEKAVGIADRRFFVRRSPNEPYQMWRASDSSFAAFSLSDPYANANLLSDALAETAELFNVNGQLMWLDNRGQLVLATMNVLHDLIPQHVALKQLRNTGTDAEPRWVAEYVPYIPDPRIVRDLFSGERREGGLLPRVTKI